MGPTGTGVDLSASTHERLQGVYHSSSITLKLSLHPFFSSFLAVVSRITQTLRRKVISLMISVDQVSCRKRKIWAKNKRRRRRSVCGFCLNKKFPLLSVFVHRSHTLCPAHSFLFLLHTVWKNTSRRCLHVTLIKLLTSNSVLSNVYRRVATISIKEIVLHFGKCAYSLSCRELDEKILLPLC